MSSAPLIPTAKTHPPSRSAQSVVDCFRHHHSIPSPPLLLPPLLRSDRGSIDLGLPPKPSQPNRIRTGYRSQPSRTAPSDGGTASARAAPPPPQAHVTRSRRGHSAAAPQRRARAALAALSCPASACAAARNRLFSFLRRMRNSPSPGRPESERCYCRLLYFL